MTNLDLIALQLWGIQRGGGLTDLIHQSRVLLKALELERETRENNGCIGVGLILTEAELKWDPDLILSKLRESVMAKK